MKPAVGFCRVCLSQVQKKRKKKGHQSIRMSDFQRWRFISQLTCNMTHCWCMKQEDTTGAGIFTLKPLCCVTACVWVYRAFVERRSLVWCSAYVHMFHLTLEKWSIISTFQQYCAVTGKNRWSLSKRQKHRKHRWTQKLNKKTAPYISSDEEISIVSMQKLLPGSG